MVKNDEQARGRQLALLGILLQSLHLFFGITAVIGMLIAQTHLKQTDQSIYHSHLVWQLVTFWCAVPGYILGFWLWNTNGQLWLIALVVALVLYRIAVNLQYWIQRRDINRLL